MEAPGREEHRTGRNGWATRLTDDELDAYNRELFSLGDAILLGRVTYQISRPLSSHPPTWPWSDRSSLQRSASASRG